LEEIVDYYIAKESSMKGEMAYNFVQDICKFAEMATKRKHKGCGRSLRVDKIRIPKFSKLSFR